MNWIKKKWGDFKGRSFLGKILFIIKKIFLTLLWLVIVFIFVSVLMWLFKTPTNNSDWELGMKQLQNVEVEGYIVKEGGSIIEDKNDKFLIKNVRDFDWRKVGNEENYKNMDFTLSDIRGMEVGISHFSKENEGLAHVFTIFNLEDGRNIAVSIETRRDGGEKFGFLKGVFFDYELIYILATKEDLLSLREKRGEKIYIYPINTTAKKAQDIFRSFSKRVNSLYENPEFYHILFKNCTSLTVDEVKKVSDKKFSWYEQVLAPGYAAQALFEMDLIKTEEKDFEKMRKEFLIKF